MNWSVTIAFILALTVLEVLAEVALKPHNNNQDSFLSPDRLLATGIILYALIATLLADVLRRSKDNGKSKLGVINTVWQALNIIVVFLVSRFIFDETFKTLQVVGVVVAMVAAILMVIPELL